MKALERSEARGHIERVSGKGFTGRFRLAFPYYPSPRELWGEWYEEDEEDEDNDDGGRKKKVGV
jgi:hypothetical protein